jgi:hypothetical protein
LYENICTLTRFEKHLHADKISINMYIFDLCYRKFQIKKLKVLSELMNEPKSMMDVNAVSVILIHGEALQVHLRK